jgi:hypothetical protein
VVVAQLKLEALFVPLGILINMKKQNHGEVTRLDVAKTFAILVKFINV